MKITKQNTYSWSSPFEGFKLKFFYNKHFIDLLGRRIRHANDFRKKLDSCSSYPEIMLIGNMVDDRARIISVCREFGIETVHSEDGFFPHYKTMHVDPLGFCWESSLPLMKFKAITPNQRERSREARSRWLSDAPQPLDHRVHKPFVLWPLQLVRDRVNRCDLNVGRWDGLITHFRRCLPTEFQLVIKPHPLGDERDLIGVCGLSASLPNTLLLHKEHPLQSLLRSSAGVAGVNSSVLYEARLMFRKPTYVYGRGWFSNHKELFVTVLQDKVQELNQVDCLADNSLSSTDYHEDYTDWFLYQLLVRQIGQDTAENEPSAFKERVFRMSYTSYKHHGEEIFE